MSSSDSNQFPYAYELSCTNFQPFWWRVCSLLARAGDAPVGRLSFVRAVWRVRYPRQNNCLCRRFNFWQNNCLSLSPLHFCIPISLLSLTLKLPLLWIRHCRKLQVLQLPPSAISVKFWSFFSSAPVISASTLLVSRRSFLFPVLAWFSEISCHLIVLYLICESCILSHDFVYVANTYTVSFLFLAFHSLVFWDFFLLLCFFQIFCPSYSFFVDLGLGFAVEPSVLRKNWNNLYLGLSRGP